MPYEYLESTVLSDPGRVRKMNEDSVLSIPEAGIFCVADGMGGAARGEVASAWAVEELRKAFEKPARGVSRSARVRQALDRASSRIKAMSDEHGSAGTGTTAVVLLFDDHVPARAGVLHAGDSRAYRVRRGRIECLTTDHSMAAAAGVKHEKALPAMFRGVVTRAVGLENEVQLEETPVTLAKNDLYLLCSDGLSKMVPDKKMQKLINGLGDTDLRVIARQLIEAANAAGGDDNISVALVRVAGDLPEGPVDLPDEPEEISTSETALEAAPPHEGEEDSSEDYAGHTPDSSDSLVAVTPETGEETPAGAASPPTAATLYPDSAGKDAAGKKEAAPGPQAAEHPAPSGEAATPQTETRDAKPGPVPARKGGAGQAFGLSTGLLLKVGAGVVVLIGLAVALMLLPGRKKREPEEIDRPARVEVASPEPAAPAAPPVAEPKSSPVQPEPVAPAAEPEPQIEDESPETAPAAPIEPAAPVATGLTGPAEIASTEELGSPPELPEPEPPSAELPEPEPPAPEPARPEPAAAEPTAPEPVEVVETAEPPEPEPTVSPEELIARLEPELGRQMPRSLTTGSWGDLLAMLAPIEAHMDLAGREIKGLRNSLIWAREWEKAGADNEYAARNLARYTDVVAGVLSAMGYEDIPDGRPVLDVSAGDVADAYCRELFRLRQVLVSRLRALVSEMKQDAGILGTNPDQALMRLHAFVNTPAEDSRAAAAAWTSAIAGLDEWLTQDSDTVIPLVGIMKGPPQLVPQVMEGRRKILAGLMSELEAGGDAVDRWKRRKGRTPVLIQIERLRATVVRRYQAARAEDAAVKWPLQGDLENIEALLANISGFMARE